MKNRISEILEENQKTPHWLSIKLGMTYANTRNMLSNNTNSIKYDVIEKVCELFNCTPNDLFTIKKED